jgi:hypothetical protein
MYWYVRTLVHINMVICNQMWVNHRSIDKRDQTRISRPNTNVQDNKYKQDGKEY